MFIRCFLSSFFQFAFIGFCFFCSLAHSLSAVDVDDMCGRLVMGITPISASEALLALRTNRISFDGTQAALPKSVRLFLHRVVSAGSNALNPEPPKRTYGESLELWMNFYQDYTEISNSTGRYILKRYISSLPGAVKTEDVLERIRSMGYVLRPSDTWDIERSEEPTPFIWGPMAPRNYANRFQFDPPEYKELRIVNTGASK